MEGAAASTHCLLPLLWQDATEKGAMSQGEGCCMGLGREGTGSGMRRGRALFGKKQPLGPETANPSEPPDDMSRF